MFKNENNMPITALIAGLEQLVADVNAEQGTESDQDYDAAQDPDHPSFEDNMGRYH